MYLEALLWLPGNNKAVVVRKSRFFFEIAGLESLTLERLFPINLLLIFALFLFIRGLWFLRERKDDNAAGRR